MTWLLELLAFVPAMIATNTPFPLPSDAVLLAFTSGRAPWLAIVFALVGAVCAGIGGLVELRIAAAVAPERTPVRRSFYVLVACVAALPIPFTAIRLLLLRGVPRPAAYASAIAFGRAPRYLAEALLVAHFTAPPWLSIGGAAVVLVVWWWRR